MSDELRSLSAQAHEVGRAAAAQREIQEDSWLVGTSRSFSEELADLGWLGMTWPVEEGGGGRSSLERFVVFEALIAEGAPVATSWFADRQIGPTLLQFGTPEQRRRWLPEIISGTSAWSIGMSEPDAGSDVASLRTTAEHRGDRWVVNGQKIWTSGAKDADWCYLIARTDPDAPPHAGLSELVVDMSLARHRGAAHRRCHRQRALLRGLLHRRRGARRPPGRHAERQLQAGDAPDGARARRHRPTRVATGGSTWTRSRPRTGSIAGCATRSAALETGYRVGRLMVLREVLGQAPAGFSAATKTYCTEFEQRVADFCGRVAGPEAMAWNRVSRNICYAPAYTIMGGTTNILRNILAERVLGLPREPRPGG